MLSSVFAKNTKKNTNGQITNVICNSAKQGLIPQREYFDKDIANSDNTSGYYIIEENDFVYNPRKSSDAPYGPISSYKYPDAGIVSPLYLCFRAKGAINPSFYEWYFRSSAWHRYVYMSGDSGARHDRVSIKDDVFFAMPISIPSAREQEHIASFLDMIDQRIDKQRALVDNLKKYKRGVLHAILHQKIRFKNTTGQEYPVWHQYTIAEIAECLDRKRVPITSNERIRGIYPYYGANGIQDYVSGYIFDGEFVLLAEDGGHFNDFSVEPIAQYVSGRVWVNNHAHILRAKCNTRFLYYSLVHKDIRNYINNPSRGKLNQEDMQSIVIDIPCDEEQRRIVEFMEHIDHHIEVNSNELTHLLNIKKFLLQQLFI